MPNMTTDISPFDSAITSPPVRHCAALKGSRYEFFWDHVSFKNKNKNANIYMNKLGLGMG